MRILAAALLALATPAVAAERVRADLACVPIADAELDYACTIRLSDAAGKPVEGADISVGADMPSMPMAHNMKPVKAVPGNEPGTYRARILLEMHGDWAVKVDLTGQVRDRIVKSMRFEPKR
jgi:hypothetical protein